MTVENFARKNFDLDTSDMIEVFKSMGYFKKDYSDWNDNLYDNGTVEDLDNIKKPTSLKNDVNEYVGYLKQYYNSRTRQGDNDLRKILIKNKIKNNKVLMKLLKNSLIDDDDECYD